MRKLKFHIILVVVFLNLLCLAQNKETDSLLKLVKTEKADTNKLIHLNKLATNYRNSGLFDSALIYANAALQLSCTLEKETTTSPTQFTIKKNAATAYNNIGIVHYFQGNYPEALKNYFAALKIFDAIAYKKGQANSYNNIGNVYDNQQNFTEALKNYFASLKIKESIGDKKGIASSYNNIGLVYSAQGNYGEALKSHFASLKIREELGDPQSIATSYNNIGLVYSYQKKYPEALEKLFAGLKILESVGDIQNMATSYNNLGVVFTKQKKFKEAYTYLIKGRNLAKEIGQKEFLRDSYGRLAELDSANGNFKDAFENRKLFIVYRDSLDNEETKKKTIQNALQYEFEKKQIAAKAEQDKKDVIATEEKKKQQVIIYAVAGVLLLVIVFSLFLLNRFRVTQKQKALIEKQKVRVDEAYEKLHEKNKEVMDSIHYARRIQTALLPSENYIAKSFNRLINK